MFFLKKTGVCELRRMTIAVLFVLMFFVLLFADTKIGIENTNGTFLEDYSKTILGVFLFAIYFARNEKNIGEIKGAQAETKELIKTEIKNVWKCINTHECKLNDCDKRLDQIEQKQAVEDALKKRRLKNEL